MPNSSFAGGCSAARFAHRRRGDANRRQRHLPVAAGSVFGADGAAGRRVRCRERWQVGGVIAPQRLVLRLAVGRWARQASAALSWRRCAASCAVCCLIEPVMSSRLCSRLAMRALSRSRSAARSRTCLARRWVSRCFGSSSPRRRRRKLRDRRDAVACASICKGEPADACSPASVWLTSTTAVSAMTAAPPQPHSCRTRAVGRAACGYCSNIGLRHGCDLCRHGQPCERRKSRH